eukprot:CAMPEP_0195157060 /NCGR_PEP_ID=MMETSP0448-20130528/184975_1 /TAXON_ID=66468 /ORGANISM="Heterocapsa triquestra, Strain CCMP 448" /LENGTH=425 /DNA_ID=CAMNT_0040195851 /DNA_START=52 /DNA_END=1330 /DNA_ORIENTATION=-
MVVCVLLHTIAGKALELTIPRDSRVKDVKVAIAKDWQVPSLFLKLIGSGAVLNDSDRIAPYCASGAQMTIALCTQKVCQDLNSGIPTRQLEALGHLAELGVKGGGGSIDAVSAQLEHRIPFVQLAAVSTLPKVAERGNARAVNAVLERLEHSSAEVRLMAVRALAAVAATRDAHAMDAVIGMLDDSDAGVRRESLVALAHIGPGDARALATVIARLEHSDAEVWCGALIALEMMAERGDARAIDAVIRRLENGEAYMRYLIRVLAKVADKGNACAAAALCSTLESGPEEVRASALAALAEVAARGHERALNLATSFLQDADYMVRAAAMQAVAEFSPEDAVDGVDGGERHAWDTPRAAGPPLMLDAFERLMRPELIVAIAVRVLLAGAAHWGSVPFKADGTLAAVMPASGVSFQGGALPPLPAFL